MPASKKPAAPPRRPTAKDMKAGAEKLPYPARQADMKLQPATSLAAYQAAGKLEGKIALITGADSGIGQAVAIAFAKEGADVAVVFTENLADAQETQRLVEKEKRRCLLAARGTGPRLRAAGLPGRLVYDRRAGTRHGGKLSSDD